MITACIIQGNIRADISIIISHFISKFDYIIISTWEEESLLVEDSQKLFIIKSKKPNVLGYSNRNLQRYSTAVGIRKARELNCDYILKWRSDMLPLKLNLFELYNYSQFDIPNGFKSRIVTCAFRNLSVYPDWFSSIPDYFSFGHIDIMDLLWGDNEFSYSKMYNTPQGMITELGEDWMANKDIAGYYCAESELYAIFKQRIQKIGNKISTHEEIVKSYFYLIDHKRLSIIWFGSNGLFRPIISLYFPWWNIRVWEGKTKVTLITAGYPQNKFWRYFLIYFVYLITKFKNYQQKKLLLKFLTSKK
jgi:hypothetical protein